MFVTYILYSRAKDKYYVGHTNDLQRRIYEQNIKRNLGSDDWELNQHKQTANNPISAFKFLHASHTPLATCSWPLPWRASMLEKQVPREGG